MSTKPETIFKNRIRPRLEDLPHSWWCKTQMQAIRGIPDFVGCVGGTFVGLELKTSKRQADIDSSTTVMQKYTLNKIRLAGGFTAFVYPENWNDIYTQLLDIANESKNKTSGKRQDDGAQKH